MTKKNKIKAFPKIVSDPMNKLMRVSWRDMIILLIPGLLLTIGIGWMGFAMMRPAPPTLS
ncbi:hypothetical protein MCEGEM3_02931 [Oxalobacteraceae bacterium]